VIASNTNQLSANVEQENRGEGDVVTTDKHGAPLSYVYSDEWDFSQERSLSATSPRKITFTTTPELHRRVIQETLMTIYNNNPTLSVGGILSVKLGLQRIVDSLGSSDWTLIDEDKHFRDFKANLKTKLFSPSSIENVAATINKISDAGITKRFIEARKNFSKKHCCPSKLRGKQAIAIPEQMAQRLFKSALDTVERYHPHRYKISQGYKLYFDALRDYKSGNGDANNFKPVIGDKIKHGVPVDDFRLDVQATSGMKIQSACLIVLLGFSGVRISECLSFNKFSYKEHVYGDITIPTLTGKITKTEEGGLPKKEAWVTHPVAKKAIELAYDLSQFARDHYMKKYNKTEVLANIETAFLVLGTSHQTKGIVAANHKRTIASFIDRHKILATSQDVSEFDLLNPQRKGELVLGANLPKISPHDFRRTFAVFLVRNKLGNIMALKHQYKHLNVIMTQWYINNHELAMVLDLSLDTELKSLVNEANISVTTDALFEIYNSETLSGGKGERIVRERDQEGYAGSVFISREDIEREVRSGSVSVIEHPTGYCFKPDCSRICSSDRSSKTCQFEAITPQKAKSRISYRSRLIERFNALNDGKLYMANILTDMALKIETIDQTLTAHNIEFTPFKADMKAKSMAYYEVGQ